MEKALRTWTSGIEAEPVRHRRERWVRAYLLVCSLPYRLEMALRWKLLGNLSRLEQTEVRLGGQARTWYLNVTDDIKDGLRRLKCSQLLEEKPRKLPTITWVRNPLRGSG